MITRRTFAAGLSGATAAIVNRTLQAQPTEPHGPYDDILQACAEACADCQRACESCSTHCAEQLAEGHKNHAVTLATCRDCADFCGAAAQIVARSGPFAGLICAPCENACAHCAEECEKFPGDPHMQVCAAECRKCEKACREMVRKPAKQDRPPQPG